MGAFVRFRLIERSYSSSRGPLGPTNLRACEPVSVCLCACVPKRPDPQVAASAAHSSATEHSQRAVGTSARAENRRREGNRSVPRLRSIRVAPRRHEGY